MNIKFIFLSSRQFLNFAPGSCKQERWQPTHCPSWELEEFLRFLTSATEIQKQVNKWAFSYSCSRILGRSFLSHKLNIKGQECSMRKALILTYWPCFRTNTCENEMCLSQPLNENPSGENNSLPKIYQKNEQRISSLGKVIYDLLIARLLGASVYHDQILLLPFVRCLFKYFHRYFCY